MALSGTITDIKLDTSSRAVVYAAAAGSGISRSTDGGATFQAFFTPTNPGMRPGLTFGGAMLAQSTRPDNRTFYATAILMSGQPVVDCLTFANPTVGLFKSTDGGTTWSDIRQGPELPTQLQGGFIPYDLTLAVDPFDANRFYYGMRGLYSATDGGASGLRDATNPGQIPCLPTQNNRIDNGAGFGFGHADQHALAFSPHATAAPSRVYIGNDGGLIATSDGGMTYAYLNNGLATILMNGFDIGHGARGNESWSYGTAQDNGLFSHARGPGGITWLQGPDGDGAAVAVDPANAMHAVAADNGNAYSTTDGQNWSTTSQLSAGTAPIVFDPNGTRVYAYVGGNLLRSTDNGNTFTKIGTFSAGVRAIAPSRTNANLLWLGLGDGTLQVTTNALGASPSFTAPQSLPSSPPGAPTSVAGRPNRPLHGGRNLSRVFRRESPGGGVSARLSDKG